MAALASRRARIAVAALSLCTFAMAAQTADSRYVFRTGAPADTPAAPRLPELRAYDPDRLRTRMPALSHGRVSQHKIRREAKLGALASLVDAA